MKWIELVMDVRLAQLDRAFGYGPKGRGFESSSARYISAVCDCARCVLVCRELYKMGFLHFLL